MLKHSHYCAHAVIWCDPFYGPFCQIKYLGELWAMAKIFFRPLFFLHPGWLTMVNHTDEGINSLGQTFSNATGLAPITPQFHCSALPSKIKQSGT